MTLAQKNILLGVTGGVAAYKSAILVRHLLNETANVQVVFTPSAHEFITATTMQALSGRSVRDDLWDREAEAAMGHIELARWADLVLVAPATAHFMACLAQGLAPNLLTTLCLATDAPIVLAPAMNQAMWRDPATQRNAAILAGDGKRILGPDEGDQACGDSGPGRMREPEELLRAVRQMLAPPCLHGRKVLVTAGPTQEALDPVRYISNHSSGRQGYAIAQAAADAGAQTTLVSGPCNLPAPANVERIEVISAQDMHDAVMARAAQQALVIGVAAVADYRPAQPAQQKIKKGAAGAAQAPLAENPDIGLMLGGQAKCGRAQILLEENPDIVAAVAALPNGPIVVGFAAETERPLEQARAKRLRKGLDAIVVNDVSNPQIGFNSSHNAANLIWEGGEAELPRQSKESLAAALIQQLADLFFATETSSGAGFSEQLPIGAS